MVLNINDKKISTFNKTSEFKVKTKTVVSLFSGCGGMDLGFEGGFQVLKRSYTINDYKVLNGKWVTLPETSFKTIFANDIREDAERAWTKYFSNNKNINPKVYHLKSIVDLVKEYNSGLSNVFPEDVDLVTGGFPCQDFSVAGKRAGFNSTKSHDGNYIEVDEPNVENRGQLYMWMREVIKITKPKVFIAENVKGLVSLGDVKEIIERDFSNVGNGYIVVPAKVLHAAEYGVPQSRERVIFYGFRKDELTKKALNELSKEFISPEYDPYPIKTHYLPNKPVEELEPFVSVGEVLDDLPEPSESDDPAQQSYSKAKYLGKSLQGQTEVNIKGIGPTIRAEHHGNIEYRRLSIENGGKNLTELNQGLIERRLTVRECARIQTFPDSYDFVWKKNGKDDKGLSASSAYKIIGNAVPPLLAYHIAKRLEENWKIYFGDDY